MYIVIALFLLAGCRTVDKAECGARETTGTRPAWFQAHFRMGTPGADRVAAHWDGVFKKGAIDDKAFLDANAILDAALMESIGDADARAILQHDRILNDCMFLLYKSHESINGTDDDIMGSTLAGRRLASILNANEGRFSDWLPAFRNWDKAHGDWSGLEWSALFDKRKPIFKLTDAWIGRMADANEDLSKDDMEKWLAAEGFQVSSIKDIEAHFVPGEKRLWLLRAIEKPEVPEGVKVYMNIHAFPGRCKVFVNAGEAISFDDLAPRSFGVPLDFKDGKKCVVIIELMELQPAKDDAVQHAPWPIWLVSDKE